MPNRRSAVADVSRLFFDRGKVQRAMDGATRRALSKFGSFVRKDARQSLRPAPSTVIRDVKGRISGSKRTTRPSPPGRPPYSRTGKLKKGIFFAYEASTRNVVIGPVLYPRARSDNLVMLEYGGRRVMKMPGRDPKQPRGVVRIRRAAHYPPRPFMRPAMEKNRPNAARLYKDQLRKAA